MSKRTVKRKRKNVKNKSVSSSKTAPARLDVSLDELKKIVSEVKNGKQVSAEEADKLGAAVDTLAVVTNELELKGASVRRLRKLLFGPSSEKMRDVFPDDKDGQRKNDHDENSKDKSKDSDDANDTRKTTDNDDAQRNNNTESDGASAKKPSEKKKPKGHGRNAAKDYVGADKKTFSHESLKAKDNCPECLKGKLYIQKEPKTLVRVIGMAPLNATVYELERLRCNLCGEIFTAKGPDGLGDEKYDHTAGVMIGMLKYGCGTPFNRLERLEKNLGIPLSSSTQWDVVHQMAISIMPIYTEFIRQAAGGDILYNDDTTARILELESPPRIGKNGKERTGLYTSGILSTKDGRRIAVFFTGRKYAGENLAEVLSHRNKELSVPIQMSDGLSTNIAEHFKTIEANCNTHARRKFVELAEVYVPEVKHILGVFKLVYKNDDVTKKENMSDDQRLEYHVANSKLLLDDLKEWFEKQFEEKNIEPNSALGTAINYMTERWNKLTLFLRVPGAPLDNNACEQILKKAILHRKNALFFKTENGAAVGDLFMTIIHTCELQNVNPFDYMVTLAQNLNQASCAPQNWMPWNYNETVATLKSNVDQ